VAADDEERRRLAGGPRIRPRRGGRGKGQGEKGKDEESAHGRKRARPRLADPIVRVIRCPLGMPVRMDLLPPRYSDPLRVGHGGMGEIFCAVDESLGRPVAIKVLSERFAEDHSVRQRFMREALAAARLSGEPNTVTIFDVGEWNERPFIVMEHLPGGTLDDRIAREGPQPVDRVLRWLEQAAAALDHAHAHGIVHRDVKPGNLLLDRDGNVHVADFGIASAAGMDSLTATGTILGTAGYLSPEQAQGQRATSASDLYGLGVVAFELLTGERPFRRESMTAEAAAHANEPVPSASARRSGLPREVDLVFQKALAKRPQHRYSSARELVDALEDALDASATDETAVLPAPAPAAPPPPAPVSAGPARRWPFVLTLLLLGALAGGLLAFALTRGGDNTAASTRVRTIVKTIQGQATTITQQVTTTAASPPPPSPPPAAGSQSGAALNDAGFTKMKAGDYQGALPLLEQAVSKLQGSGQIVEAYADYNLAATLLQLGRCDRVKDLLKSSERIQGHRDEIDAARAQEKSQCRGGGNQGD
jgi:eukaryotic-like serine/threonine-protein kinase